jgi:hypothetical protein
MKNKKTDKWLKEIENKNGREGECQNARVDHRK